MQNAIKRGMSRYARFSGRASRPEFWWWALFVFLILAIAQIIDARVIAPLLGLGAL